MYTKTPHIDDGESSRCRDCKVEISQRHPITVHDAEGNDTGSSIFVKLCTDCGAERDRRFEERRVDDARRRAKYEKTLADLIASIPKPKHEQATLDLGLD